MILFALILISVPSIISGQSEDISSVLNDIDLIDQSLLLSYIDQICAEIETIEPRTSYRCYKQIQAVCNNDTFKTTMADATSKFPYTGMLVKSKLDLGSYDECVALEAKVDDDSLRILGKHCTAGLRIPAKITNNTVSLKDVYLLSTCVPDQCSAQDFWDLFNLSAALRPLMNDDHCFTKESYNQLSWDAYLMITFLALLLVAIVVATACDLYSSGRTGGLLVRAFSIVHNGGKLFKVSSAVQSIGGEQIDSIHGLRVISMMWIILGHSFSSLLTYPGNNIESMSDFEWHERSLYVTTAHLAVDTFFFISGFLLAYQYLKGARAPFRNHVRRVPFMILHRYIRLTPAVAAVYLTFVALFMYLGDGPIYKVVVEHERQNCLDHWWTFFTYTQNYVNFDNLCIIPTWYLSADWQLFLISPLVLVPVAMLIRTHFKWVMSQLIVLNLLLTLLPIALKLVTGNFNNPYETHTRLNVYFIGFTVGAYMRVAGSRKPRLSPKITLLIWAGCLILMGATTLIYKEVQLTAHFQNNPNYEVYFIVLRAFWAIAIGWVIYACHHGYGGYVNSLLTTSNVQILSRLTFCMYLLHPAPSTYFRIITRSPIEYGQIEPWQNAIFSYFVTVVLSVGFTLAFESPFITLEKYFLQRNTPAVVERTKSNLPPSTE